jgi:hypothetical protein
MHILKIVIITLILNLNLIAAKFNHNKGKIKICGKMLPFIPCAPSICPKYIGGTSVVYDTRCSTGKIKIGCNAGGVRLNCRFCGGLYDEC